ncbi:MAG: Crp/Fnr family transcriptional regulator [Chloroflexi bacterium]|nr:Crp/Fnr family transcriptional regulator [Chloroflexota bacterium]
MADALELLRAVPFFAAIAPSDLRALADTARRRRFAKGQTIFHKDDPGNAFYLIEEGVVQIYEPNPEGRELIVAILGGGDFFGELSLLDGKPRAASALALQDAITLMILRDDFVKFVHSNMEAALAILAAVAQLLRQSDEVAQDLAFLDVPGRLAKKLLDLAESHGRQTPDGIVLDLPLTQETMARLVGVTRESLNRHVSLFRRLGLLQMEGKRWLIARPDELRRRTAPRSRVYESASSPHSASARSQRDQSNCCRSASTRAPSRHARSTAAPRWRSPRASTPSSKARCGSSTVTSTPRRRQARRNASWFSLSSSTAA